MGIALSVFKISDMEKERFVKLKNKKISNQDFQQTFEEYADLKRITAPNSILTLKSYDKNEDIVTYRVKHYSDIQSHPVKVFFTKIEDGIDYTEYLPKENTTYEFENGYQIAYYFDVIIDFKQNELFVFTKKDIAKQFVKRFENNGAFKIEHRDFNLEKIDELPELDNVFALWEDVSKGRVKKKAYFGTQVHKEGDVELDKITSYNIEYKSGEKLIHDLFIAKDCRIGSQSSQINDKKLIDIYYHIKEVIGFL